MCAKIWEDHEFYYNYEGASLKRNNMNNTKVFTNTYVQNVFFFHCILQEAWGVKTTNY